MSNFCNVDQGFDYIFGRMSAIYGNDFARKWDGIDANLIRSEWTQTLGKFLTYKPSMDYALENLPPDRPPSSLQFRKICQGGPGIPVPDAVQIANNPTVKYTEEQKRKALAQLEALKRSFSDQNASTPNP
jgi:hypothetical protein